MMKITKNILTKSTVEEVIRKNFGHKVYAIDLSSAENKETYWSDIMCLYLNNNVSKFALSTVYEDKKLHIQIETNTITIKTYKRDVLVGMEVCTRIVGLFDPTAASVSDAYYVVSFGKKGLFKKAKHLNKGETGTKLTREFETNVNGEKNHDAFGLVPAYVYDCVNTFRNVGSVKKERVFNNGVVVSQLGKSKETLWVIKNVNDCNSFQNIEYANSLINKEKNSETNFAEEVFC